MDRLGGEAKISWGYIHGVIQGTYFSDSVDEYTQVLRQR